MVNGRIARRWQAKCVGYLLDGIRSYAVPLMQGRVNPEPAQMPPRLAQRIPIDRRRAIDLFRHDTGVWTAWRGKGSPIDEVDGQFVVQMHKGFRPVANWRFEIPDRIRSFGGRQKVLGKINGSASRTQPWLKRAQHGLNRLFGNGVSCR